MNQAVHVPHRRPSASFRLPGLELPWQALSPAERVVLLYIVFLPAWWVVGLYRYIPLFTLLGVLAWQYNRTGRIHFGRPNWWILAPLLSFVVWQFVPPLLNGVLGLRDILTGFLFWVSPALLLWFVQGNSIRVRLNVVVWAFAVAVAEVVGAWLVIHFVFGEPPYNAQRTLLAVLTGKPSEFDFHNYGEDNGKANYLVPYAPSDYGFFGLTRYIFWFLTPEVLGLMGAVSGLLALDAKSRPLKYLMLLGSIFILLVSGARSVLLTFPVVVTLRYIFSLGRSQGPAILCALAAVLSFATLSTPPVTEFLVGATTNTVEATSDFRKDSTRVRSLIYQRTLEQIPDQLLTGHGKAGLPIFNSFALGRVGTHSFILGNLLYTLGLVGFVLFAAFWSALSYELYRTRAERSMAGLAVLLLFTLVSPVMTFGSELVNLLVVLVSILYLPGLESSPAKFGNAP